MVKIPSLLLCLFFGLASVTPFALQHEASGSSSNLSAHDTNTTSNSRFTLRVETSSRIYAGSSRASVQFLVDGKWTSPQSLRERGWQPGDDVEKDFETQAWPTHVRLMVGGRDAWGYRQILLIDSAGDEYVVLNSENGKPYGNNDFWLDGDEISVPQRDFRVPSAPSVVEFILHIESMRSNAGASMLSAQFLVNDRWTEPRVLEHVLGDIGKKEFLMLKRPVSVTSSLFTKTRAWPSTVRLNTHPSDKHIKVLLIDDAGYEHVVFNSSASLRDGIELSDSRGVIEVVQRDYTIPSARFTVQVQTSTQKDAGGSRASVQFLVNGHWTPPQKFQRIGWSVGAVLKKDFETQAWPRQLRLINDCHDAWGYKRIVVVDPSGHEHVVLDSSNGARYGDNEFWLDGDEIKVPQRDFDVPSRKDEL